MKSYLVRGHGEILPNTFKLRNGQYVIFAQPCGDPALAYTTLEPEMKRILRSPNLMSRYIRGNLNKTKFPGQFRNPIILGPGNNVRNMSINMKNNDMPWLHKTFGIWNTQMKQYIRGRNKEIKLSSQNGIGNRKGLFFVDSCRVRSNFSPKNSVSERILAGLPSGLRRTKSNLQTHAYELYRTKRFQSKRKRPSSNITLRKKSSPSPLHKRRKTTTNSPNVVVREPPRKKRIGSFSVHKIF